MLGISELRNAANKTKRRKQAKSYLSSVEDTAKTFLGGSLIISSSWSTWCFGIRGPKANPHS